jgi:hypothetical protein
MGGDVVYKGEHFFRKDQLAKKTNEEIGQYILNKYFLDYGNTYKYSIIRTGETKTKMADGGGLENEDESNSYGRFEDYDDNFQKKMREKAARKMMQQSNYQIEDYKESNFNKNDDDSAVKMDRQLKYKAIIGNYEPYHNTLSEVLSEAERFVNNRGYKFSEESYFPDITNGGVPYGQTVRTRRDIVEIGGKNRSNALILSVYRLESGRYELVMYFAKSKY